MKSFDCTASIVVYNNPPDMIRRAIKCLISSSVHIAHYIIDNSQTPALESSLTDLPCIYQFNDYNYGYGSGHNKAIEAGLPSHYHMIINPDIIIAPSTIEALCSFMDSNPDIGIVSPKILNEDGTIQPLNKRHPTVFDLFARRFIPKSLQRFIQRRLDRYEMKDIGYENICDVEFVTGCFMFCRTDALKAVGGFDERYFMYLEDADLSRKIQQAGYRTVFYPHVAVTHLWERASHKKIKMTLIHIRSAIAYFNKWGWKLI